MSCVFHIGGAKPVILIGINLANKDYYGLRPVIIALRAVFGVVLLFM